MDVIIDFSRFGPGTEVYLVNRLEQANGRGPTERIIGPSDYDSDDGFFKANAVVAFEVEGTMSESTQSYGSVAPTQEPETDPSVFPLLSRDFPPIDFTERS